MMKAKKTRKILALTLITAILGISMNLSIASAETLDNPVLKASKSESKVPETANAQANIYSNVLDIPIQLNDGETIKIPLIKSPNKPTDKTTDTTTNVYTASSVPEIGTMADEYGVVSVSRVNNVISYNITLFMVYTSIAGTVNITDYYSGLSAGFQPLISPVGSITCNGFSGHTYRLTIQATALLLVKPVATVYAQAGWTQK